MKIIKVILSTIAITIAFKLAFGFYHSFNKNQSNAQSDNEYGLNRSMTNQEFGRYEECQEAVRPLMWPELVNGKQMTFSEALGPAITKRICACSAIRMRTNSDSLASVWQGCVHSVIGG